MNTKTQRDPPAGRIGSFAGAVGGVLLISLGLELLAHQMFGRTDVATFLLAVYLGFWFSVLGIVGFVVLSTAWLMTWRSRPAEPAADPGDHECAWPMAIPVAQSREAARRDDAHLTQGSCLSHNESGRQTYLKGA